MPTRFHVRSMAAWPYNESRAAEMTLKAPNVYYLALCRKGLSIPTVGHRGKKVCLPVDQMGA